ncbi:MAG: universal stress protein [Chloroflexota bacterium]|nr:universal stress protein [Chloroflexota bacterium]MDE2897052.1 universal stress protein [Chloroflexota bacterium]
MAYQPERPVIAAVSGRHMDEAVVTTAALLARARSTSILLLHVIEVSHRLPLNVSSDEMLGQAETVLADARRLLPSNGASVRTEIKQARSAFSAIVETSLAEEADTIVVGAHRFLGEHDCDLGRTATHVLRHAVTPVVVCYDPIR